MRVADMTKLGTTAAGIQKVTYGNHRRHAQNGHHADTKNDCIYHAINQGCDP